MLEQLYNKIAKDKSKKRKIKVLKKPKNRIVTVKMLI